MVCKIVLPRQTAHELTDTVLGKGALVAGTAYTCAGAQPFSREAVAFFLRFEKSREMWRSPLPYRRSGRCKERGDLNVHQARQPARAGRRTAPQVDALNPVTKAPSQPPKERSGGGSKLSAV